MSKAISHTPGVLLAVVVAFILMAVPAYGVSIVALARLRLPVWAMVVMLTFGIAAGVFVLTALILRRSIRSALRAQLREHGVFLCAHCGGRYPTASVHCCPCCGRKEEVFPGDRQHRVVRTGLIVGLVWSTAAVVLITSRVLYTNSVTTTQLVLLFFWDVVGLACLVRLDRPPFRKA